jgi:hypothetical protein
MKKWEPTPEIREAITRVYHTRTEDGQVRDLAKSLGLPRWRITRWGIEWGLIAKQRKEPDWTEKEITILRRSAHLCAETIQGKLNRQGFHRTVTGIILKRKRMRLLRNLSGMSANSLSLCLGVDSHFVIRAIKGNRLRVTMRKTKRKKTQGGDIYYIKDRDIKKYILSHLNEIDIRKVDKYWFVDLLINRT